MNQRICCITNLFNLILLNKVTNAIWYSSHLHCFENFSWTFWILQFCRSFYISYTYNYFQLMLLCKKSQHSGCDLLIVLARWSAMQSRNIFNASIFLPVPKFPGNGKTSNQVGRQWVRMDSENAWQEDLQRSSETDRLVFEMIDKSNAMW